MEKVIVANANGRLGGCLKKEDIGIFLTKKQKEEIKAREEERKKEIERRQEKRRKELEEYRKKNPEIIGSRFD